MSNHPLRHILHAQQFDRSFLDELFERTRFMESRPEASLTSLRGRILATLFYQPSTRTRLSFESAMLRLGGTVISTENAKEFSSAAKGETLEDTIRIVSGYADVIALRHHEPDSSERAAAVAAVPIINAGSGTEQHPTQALLDYYTALRELEEVPRQIAFVGDLKNGRTVRSLVYLLGHSGVRVAMRFVSPPELRIGDDIKHYLERHEIRFCETKSLDEGMAGADAVYMTRIQKESFADLAQYERLKGCYRLDAATVQRHEWKQGERILPILMHPLPRNDEIAPDVDALPQAAYFRQAKYGLYVRMALLKMTLAA